VIRPTHQKVRLAAASPKFYRVYWSGCDCSRCLPLSAPVEQTWFADCQSFDRLLKLRTPFWSETWCHLRSAIDFAWLRLTWQLATAAHSRVRRCCGSCGRGRQRGSGRCRGGQRGDTDGLRLIFR